jgi:hypothetical protein
MHKNAAKKHIIDVCWRYVWRTDVVSRPRYPLQNHEALTYG